MNIMEAIKFFTGPTLAMFLSGLLVAFFSLIPALKKEHTPQWVHWLGFAAAILVAVASVWGAIVAEKDALLIQAKTQRIADLAETNVVLGAQVANISAQNTALLAGGHNYCAFHVYMTDSNVLTWTIDHRNDQVPLQGDKINAPVLDVKATVWDIDRLCDRANASIRETLKTMPEMNPDEKTRLKNTKLLEMLQNPDPAAIRHWDIGTVLPYELSIFRKEIIAETDELWFRVWFHARNGRWQETIILRKVNGKWLSAHKMNPMSGYSPNIRNTQVQMDSGFPTNGLPQGW
ncbi:MAG: hypothetical protein HY343_07500 [Lentisphaerae bacterium]|nr:hypothetical protein [Lentisphaerota bacterium]